jgi:hypothetical protein
LAAAGRSWAAAANGAATAAAARPRLAVIMVRREACWIDWLIFVSLWIVAAIFVIAITI